MIEQYTQCGFNITIDPQFQNDRYGNSPELAIIIERLFFESQDKSNKKVIDELIGLIKQYPQSPHLKNYLSCAYTLHGKKSRADEVNKQILAEHPEYLFGKINEAYHYIEKDQPEKVPQLLGEGLELKELYPERDLFHLAEITGFLKTVICYYVEIENLKMAENKYQILKEIAPTHPDTYSAESYMFRLKMQEGLKRMQTAQENRIEPVISKQMPESNKLSLPVFNHPEIKKLYYYGLDISHDILHEIIALPRESLIEDLETILLDAVERYKDFAETIWEEETHNFVVHALFLLSEIDAKESLPKIFSLLEYEPEFLDFWLGEFLTDILWICIYKLGFNQTEILKEFLLKPGISSHAKIVISEALTQIVVHNPERRTEILSIYTEVFTMNSVANIKDNLIDSDFLGLTIYDTIICELNELLPIIKILFDKGFVNPFICGDYDEVVNHFELHKLVAEKRELYNIFEFYNSIDFSETVNDEDEDEFDEEYNEEDDLDDFFTEQQFSNYTDITYEQAVSNKVGRNEPCPCGSGKKYKKCCINKI